MKKKWEALSIFVTPFEGLFPTGNHFLDVWRIFNSVRPCFRFTFGSCWFLDERIRRIVMLFFVYIFFLDLYKKMEEN